MYRSASLLSSVLCCLLSGVVLWVYPPGLLRVSTPYDGGPLRSLSEEIRITAQGLFGNETIDSGFVTEFDQCSFFAEPFSNIWGAGWGPYCNYSDSFNYVAFTKERLVSLYYPRDPVLDLDSGSTLYETWYYEEVEKWPLEDWFINDSSLYESTDRGGFQLAQIWDAGGSRIFHTYYPAMFVNATELPGVVDDLSSDEVERILESTGTAGPYLEGSPPYYDCGSYGDGTHYCYVGATFDTGNDAYLYVEDDTEVQVNITSRLRSLIASGGLGERFTSAAATDHVCGELYEEGEVECRITCEIVYPYEDSRCVGVYVKLSGGSSPFLLSSIIAGFVVILIIFAVYLLALPNTAEKAFTSLFPEGCTYDAVLGSRTVTTLEQFLESGGRDKVVVASVISDGDDVLVNGPSTLSSRNFRNGVGDLVRESQDNFTFAKWVRGYEVCWCFAGAYSLWVIHLLSTSSGWGAWYWVGTVLALIFLRDELDLLSVASLFWRRRGRLPDRSNVGLSLFAGSMTLLEILVDLEIDFSRTLSFFVTVWWVAVLILSGVVVGKATRKISGCFDDLERNAISAIHVCRAFSAPLGMLGGWFKGGRCCDIDGRLLFPLGFADVSGGANKIGHVSSRERVQRVTAVSTLCGCDVGQSPPASS